MPGQLAILGLFGGTHIGGSLKRAAEALDIDTVCFDAGEAMGSSRILQSLAWRLADRQPVHMGRFGRNLIAACRPNPPAILIATGSGPLEEQTLLALRALGVVTVNVSTDDPWNSALSSRWHMNALPHYDLVFTPRSSNVEDLRRLGCREVRRLPFGYDDALFTPESAAMPPGHDVLFVGGADRDRLDFMTAFMRTGLRPALVGGYWHRYPQTRPLALGVRPPDELRRLTAAAKVNLCLVRRANRDGHVMRSFEIAAVGGCMLAEDTAEHREIFGEDGEAVVYFSTPEAAARRARELIDDPATRQRLSAAVRARIAGGSHTYRHRLATILATVADRRPAPLGASTG
jgi:spore maturation protein CgeB